MQATVVLARHRAGDGINTPPVSDTGARSTTIDGKRDVTDEGGGRVWYVAYGSNIDEERFAQYLATTAQDPRVSHRRARWVTIDHALYFAGTSKTWGGPVAFVSVLRDQSVRTRGLARLLEWKDVETIARKENGAEEDETVLPTDLPDQGKWTQLDVTMDDTKGKYNALLRLADIDGVPAVTLTTLRSLPLGTPTSRYRELIEAASGKPTDGTPPWGASSNRAVLPREEVTLELTLRYKDSPGMTALTLPASERPDGEAMLIGTVSSASASRTTWIRFDKKVKAGTARVDATIARSLGVELKVPGKDQGEKSESDTIVTFRRPLHYRILGGESGDIPDSDVVYLSPTDAALFDGWALLITARGGGPVRIKSRDHVPLGAARVAYALRVITSITKDSAGKLTGHVALQPLPDPNPLLSKIQKMTRWLGEIAIGAPPIALRSTEGLVGDDGKDVVRVDPTALDYLGCASGDSVIVSWARKSHRARVLLHTDVTRERMHAQFAETTGSQSRESWGDIEARREIPHHLQAWLSSSVRHQLDIPPDSIVRLRRSTTRTLAKHSALLSLPLAGLVLAALAVPDIGVFALAAVPPVVLLALAQIRMPHR